MNNRRPETRWSTNHHPNPRGSINRLNVVRVVLTLVVVAAASAGVAQNLVVNPDFDTDTSGWTGPGVWDSFDVDGQPTSGSATYVNSSAGTAGFVFERQCVAIDPMIVGYDLRAWTYVASGQAATGNAKVNLVWYTDTLCSDYFTHHQFPVPSLFDAWEQAGGSVFTPYMAQSVQVSATNQKYGAGNFQVFADAFSLEANSSSTMIFGDSFESGNPGAWSDVSPGPS